ncbi:Inositol polyphosphate 5-phosphatase [Entamoeba marina]
MSFSLPYDLNINRNKHTSYPLQLSSLNESDYAKYLSNPKEWFQSKMQERWFQYAEPLPIRTTFITWNVAESDPSSIATPFFDDAQLFVVALEEVDMTLSAFVTSGQTELLIQWKSLLESNLPHNHYDCIVAHQYGGLALFIFADESTKALIKNTVTQTVAVGMLGIANKGAIGVSMDIGVCKLLFVAAHLSANMGPEKCDEDFAIIRKEFQFETPVLDHDYEIWLGDFNYRLDATPEYIRANLYDVQALAKVDQLTNSVTQSKAFIDFIEAPLRFLPTYRMIKGSDKYDWKRSPAWCDRVLFRVYHTYKVSIHSYERVELYYSDHIPVRCCATLKPRVINDELLKKAWSDVLQLSNTITKDLVPKCSLSTRTIQYENIKPYCPTSQNFSILNIGKIPAVYSFDIIDASNGTQIEPSWLKITPSDGVLAVGECINVNVVIILNAESAKSIREKKVIIMELKVVDGSVYYIEVEYHVVQTSFGLSLKELCDHPLPFNERSDNDHLEKNDLVEENPSDEVQLKDNTSTIKSLSGSTNSNTIKGLSESTNTIKELSINKETMKEHIQSNLPKEIQLFISALKLQKTNSSIFTTIPNNMYNDIYANIFEYVDNCWNLFDFDLCRLSEAFLLFVGATGGLLTPMVLLYGDIDVINELCDGVNKQFIRVLCALCRDVSICSSVGRSTEEILTYFSQSLVQRKLEMNELAEIGHILKIYTQTVKSIEFEMENEQ